MLKSKNKVETNTYDLEVSVSAEEFEAAIQQVYNRKRKGIALPGFRKGKATRKMIESFYGKGVFYEDALESVYPVAVDEALKESELDVVDYNADVKDVGENGVELLLKVTVKPEEISIEKYKGLEAEKPEATATKEDIEQEIDRLLERNSRMVTVEDRAAQDGDIAVIDFEGFVDGVAFEGGKGENHSLTLGSGQFIPGFEEQVIGRSVNDEFDVNVTFPEEYAPELAGKEAVFKVKLHEVKFKEMPELDDDFAKDVGEDYETVADLKKGIKEELSEKKAEHAKQTFEENLLKIVADNLKAEIPEVMFKKKAEENIESFSQRISQQGIDLNTYLSYVGMDRAKFEGEMFEQAVTQVKIQLALEKIAEIEKITVSEQEIDDEIAKMAEAYSIDVETVKKVVTADNISSDIKGKKAVDLIAENAKVIKPEAEKKAKEEATKPKTAAKAKTTTKAKTTAKPKTTAKAKSDSSAKTKTTSAASKAKSTTTAKAKTETKTAAKTKAKAEDKTEDTKKTATTAKKPAATKKATTKKKVEKAE
ncbi:MAG TPA: trigger factor [Clostridia bacterium]|nr:trigger factor [Clostridia bacterium]